MPHMDMDISESGTDYSDYEYQIVNAQVSALNSQDSTGTNSPAVNANFEIEPLGGIGGLDNNEVAELVAMELYVFMEHEDEEGDQNVGTSTEFRGVVGINLAANNAALTDVSSGSAEIAGNVWFVDNLSEANAQAEATTDSDDRQLQIFKVAGGPPFDDASSGVGGNNFTTQFHKTKNFRELTQRGPVLDSTDDIVIASRLVAEDTVLDITGDIKMHLLWDTAEVSDAGRAFSVPTDD